MAAQQFRPTTPWPLIPLLIGGVLLFFGSILISVGIIRWGIWPLIERAERD